MPDETRKRIYQRLRQHLRRGRVDRVITELTRRAPGKYRDHAVWREIEYFTKHADHMAYAQLRGLGLPMGSGAIESAIRRVVNQRLKGNSITWLQENAEAMLVLRAAALTDRLEDTFDHVHTTMAADRHVDWQWTAPDMRAQHADPSVDRKPPKHPPPASSQLLENKGVTAIAA